jgi:hypothetical protein
MNRTYILGRFRIWLSIRKVTKMQGICSNLEDGNHILLFDFDSSTLAEALRSLMKVQSDFDLAPISILQTRQDEGYIAYCFCRKPFRDCIAILCQTEGVDWNFIRLSCIRGYITLRISPKRGVKPKLVAHLSSRTPEQATIEELVRAIDYETSYEG